MSVDQQHGPESGPAEFVGIFGSPLQQHHRSMDPLAQDMSLFKVRIYRLDLHKWDQRPGNYCIRRSRIEMMRQGLKGIAFAMKSLILDWALVLLELTQHCRVNRCWVLLGLPQASCAR